MHFWEFYGLFLAKAVTAVIAIIVVVGAVLGLTRKNKSHDKHWIEIKKLNEKFTEFADVINAETLSKKAYKQFCKEKKIATKSQKEHAKNRLFVLQFTGDIKASAVSALREEITALLTVATPRDEVVVRLESPGGMISAYGLAASQLQRLRDKKIPLTVIVDKVAASGGYMMACIANHVLAAPFAIIGSIGVIAQLPNFHRLLKKNDIDFEQLTAGEYKRTLTLFGENTKKGRQKFQEEIEEIHEIFKDFIGRHRPQIDIDKIATGEHWLGVQALPLKLIDGIRTSDDYLLAANKQMDIYQVRYMGKKSLGEKLTGAFSQLGMGFRSLI